MKHRTITTTTPWLIVMALVLAACSSDQPSPSADASASESMSAPTETPASEAPSPSEVAASDEPDDSAIAIPSFDVAGDPELAGRFPETVGGQPMQVISMRGDAFMNDADEPAFRDFLARVGADLSDVSVAFGGAAAGEAFFSIAAFRVLGASEDELEEEFLDASEAADDLGEIREATVGGKDVLTATDPDDEFGVGTVFIYTKDDTVYWMAGPEDLAAEVLEALP